MADKSVERLGHAQGPGWPMGLVLRRATDQELAFCEALNRRNMGRYLAARGIPWDQGRFLASWAEFENLMILEDPEVVGLLRLAPEHDALALRDLQVVPGRQRQGIGTWAVRQAQSIAAARGVPLQLRVHEENPAKALYSRLGFRTQSVVGGTVHMVWALPPDGSSTPTPLRGAAVSRR